MIETGDGYLMFIEPQKPCEEAVYDRYTMLAALAWERASPDRERYRGFHYCACGATSDNLSWRTGGLLTNSLLLHYVMHHRSEVPEEELEKLDRFEEDA